MSKLSKKIIIILALLLLFEANTVCALEINYPRVPGTMPPQDYINYPSEQIPMLRVKYFFNLIIWMSGVIGLAVLVFAGIHYLTSIGKPEKLMEARKRILSAFWGIILLLSSYLLLTIINPRLISPGPLVIPEIPLEMPETPIYTYPTVDLLARIKVLAERTKEIPAVIKETAARIIQFTDACDCQNTKPSCLCAGGGPGSACQPRTCYTGSAFNPCPDHEEIKKLQKQIVDQRDVILYYRNRALAEKEDLWIDISQILDEKISWFEQEIGAEQEILSRIQDQGAREVQQRNVDYLEERKGWLEEEKGYKEELVEKLRELAEVIARLAIPTAAIPQLSAQCFSNVGTECTPSCKIGGTYGCHDRLSGCQPDKCSGGNPCPPEIRNRFGEITPGDIIGICDQIISIVDSIEREKEIRINL